MIKRESLDTNSKIFEIYSEWKNNVSIKKKLLSVYSLKRWAGIQTVFLSCCEPDISSTGKRCIRGRDRGRGSCITVWIADIDIRRSIVEKRRRVGERGRGRERGRGWGGKGNGNGSGNGKGEEEKKLKER